MKRICIVGGGPAAVAAAKHLRAERCFTHIDLFEQRSRLGGVWDYTPENDVTESCPIPHTKPSTSHLERPVWRRDPISGGCIATYVSPVYERLEANLPKMLMQHSNMAFSNDCQLFPDHQQIFDYLERYADDVRHMVRFETQVTGVQRIRSNSSLWAVTARDLTSNVEFKNEYNGVVIACGHYNVPFVPDYKGIRRWHSENREIITHSKHFTRPENYQNKKVLIVGNGPSGSDIASQIAPLCTHPLYISTRTAVPDTSLLPEKSLNVPGIASFLPSNSNGNHQRAVCLIDGSVIDNLDAIIFCTGYLYTYPFLVPPDASSPLITSGSRVHNVFQHVFYMSDPTLTFLTLPWNIVPFPVAEVQSATIARVWSGRLSLPDGDTMRDWEKAVEGEMGNARDFHKLPPPKDIDYINELSKWCCSASPGRLGDTSSSGAVGLQPPRWDDQMAWLRMNVGKIRREFRKRGQERRNVKRLEDLGYTWEERDAVEKQARI